MRRALVAAVVAAVALAATACGDDTTESATSSTATATTVPRASAAGEDERCQAFRAIADTDDEMSSELVGLLGDAVSTAGPEGELSPEVLERLAGLEPMAGQVAALYDDLASTLDPPEADAARVLGSYTTDVLADLAAARSVDELQAAATPDPAATSEAVEATFTLHRLSTSACGIVLAD